MSISKKWWFDEKLFIKYYQINHVCIIIFTKNGTQSMLIWTKAAICVGVPSAWMTEQNYK